jgi:hypothetical protein
MQILSDFLNAVLYPGNLKENGWYAEKANSPVIQHFSYKCQRSRNDAGMLYGNTIPSELKFTIRLGKPEDSKLFYQQLTQNELSDHTFIFNATFDQDMRLKAFEDAMMVSGYVVDVKEDYNSAATMEGHFVPMQVGVTLLLSSITYVGKENRYCKLNITQF